MVQCGTATIGQRQLRIATTTARVGMPFPLCTISGTSATKRSLLQMSDAHRSYADIFPADCRPDPMDLSRSRRHVYSTAETLERGKELKRERV